MGELRNFSVRMKSRALHELASAPAYGPLAIRLMPMSPSQVEEAQLPQDTTWAWAIVQLRPGEPDALLRGGPAASMSEAEARARECFKDMEEDWAQGRAERISTGQRVI